MNEFQKYFFKKHDINRILIKLLEKGVTILARFDGNSMKPFLDKNTLITVKSINLVDIKCGDVVLYKTGQDMVVHRFLKYRIIMQEKYVITKGDRNHISDLPVPFNDLLGKIIQIEKGNRVINYESWKWNLFNYFLGKFAPYFSTVESTIRFPRRCASKLFILFIGINYKAYIEKRKNAVKSKQRGLTKVHE